MNKLAIGPGKNAPDAINVLIEIPQNSDPIKYEYDKETGLIMVDRFMPTSMSYPCNYGFIPQTLGGDGDPLDVLVISRYPIAIGAVINAKPIGVLITEDESGEDAKILAVPSPKIDQFFANINEYSDFPEIMLGQISHFFESYKALEKGKWVKVKGWKQASEAKQIILDGIASYK